MRSRNPAARGGFDSSFDELLPLLAVQPHQLSAARQPAEPIRNIVGERDLSRGEIGRLVNARLGGPDETRNIGL